MNMTKPKRTFTFSNGFDVSITLQVDTTVMTPDLASQINGFWSGAQDVLRAAKGDVIQAAARRAVPYLLHSLIDGSVEAAESLSHQEGWPEVHGITVIDHELPDLDDSTNFDCVEG